MKDTFFFNTESHGVHGVHREFYFLSQSFTEVPKDTSQRAATRQWRRMALSTAWHCEKPLGFSCQLRFTAISVTSVPSATSVFYSIQSNIGHGKTGQSESQLQTPEIVT